MIAFIRNYGNDNCLIAYRGLNGLVFLVLLFSNCSRSNDFAGHVFWLFNWSYYYERISDSVFLVEFIITRIENGIIN